jgi:ankyrin repeat protein
LQYAAEYGSLDIFKFLSKYGWPYQCAVKSKVSPLHLAWKKRHHEIVNHILNEIDTPLINFQRDNGLTGLMYSSIIGDLKTIKLLVNNGAYITIKTQNNTTALYLVAKHGHAQVVYHILRYEGVDVNEKWDNSESTPLHAACLSGKIDVIRVLLHKGADCKIRNKNDENALDCAAKSDNTHVLLRIVQKFINDDHENSEQFNEIFNYENKINGLTLLTRLVLDNNFKVAKLLFNSKVQVDYQHSKDGDTVLHKCIKMGGKKAIGFWLFINCDKN